MKNNFLKFQFSSIKTKMIIAYATIVTLTILIFALAIFWYSEKVVVRLARQNVEQTILASHQALNSRIDNINACMLSFQVKEEVQEILCNGSPDSAFKEIDTLEQALMEVDMFQNNISKLELYVLGRDDYPPPSSGGSVFSVGEMKNDIWFNNALKHGSSAKWTVRNNLDETKSVIVISKLITDVTTNEPVAVLKAEISIRNFISMIDNVSLADTGRLFICSSNALVGNVTSDLGRQIVNNTTLFNDMLQSNKNETRQIILDGEAYLLSTYSLKGTGLFLVGAVKIKEFSSTQNAISVSIFITAFILLLLSIIFIRFVSSMITKPISSLTAVMSKYKPGDVSSMQNNSNDEIGVLFTTFNNMQTTIKELFENVEKESAIRKRAELKALQAQITPHFLYNTLNSICVLAKKYNAKDIQQMIIALSKFFMISLSNGAEMITLEQEMEHVNSYMYLQKIRYEDRFTLYTDIPDELRQNIICKLTIQPLVENCINHAFADMTEPGIIEISARQEHDDIIITVSDNGTKPVDIDELNQYVNKEFEPDEPIEKYGIHNINQRIHLYFGESSGLYYTENTPNGLTAVIRIKSLSTEVN